MGKIIAEKFFAEGPLSGARLIRAKYDDPRNKTYTIVYQTKDHPVSYTLNPTQVRPSPKGRQYLLILMTDKCDHPDLAWKHEIDPDYKGWAQIRVLGIKFVSIKLS